MFHQVGEDLNHQQKSCKFAIVSQKNLTDCQSGLPSLQQVRRKNKSTR